MTDVIKLVQGDNRPEITCTIENEAGDVISLAGATAQLHFRKKGTTTLLFSVSGALVTDGTDGKVRFNFAGGVLNIEQGRYEGEIEITFPGGDKQTVYEPVQFYLREDFG